MNPHPGAAAAHGEGGGELPVGLGNGCKSTTEQGSQASTCPTPREQPGLFFSYSFKVDLLAINS